MIFSAFVAVASADQKAPKADCEILAETVRSAVSVEGAQILEITSREVAANSHCACEIVKVVIETAKPEVEAVAAIVEVAILAAPEHMRLIAQCGIAASPDALAQILAVLAKYDPNAGEAGRSAKSAKGEKAALGEAAADANPLDFPGQGPVVPLFSMFPGIPALAGYNPFNPFFGPSFIPAFTPIIDGPSDEPDPDDDPPTPPPVDPPVVTNVNP